MEEVGVNKKLNTFNHMYGTIGTLKGEIRYDSLFKFYKMSCDLYAHTETVHKDL